MNVNAHYRLAPGVAIRPERFGGLVYRYDNRRLFFLHSHELVEFVSSLDGRQSLQAALEGFLASRGQAQAEVSQVSRETLVKAVVQLEKLGIVAQEVRC